MNISMAIADLNKEYLYRLTEILQQNRELNISVFTSLENLQEAMDKTRFDVLLFDPDISVERISLSRVKLAVCLYSDECRNIDNYRDCKKVLKYQRVSNIYKYVLGEYADKAGYSLELNSQTNTKLIGIYSPVGGAGKTAFSLALACKLKLLGNKVLFFSTEQYDSSSVINEYEEEGITALVEAVNDESINFKIKLTAVTRHGLENMDYLSGFTKLVDYEAVTEDEITRVLQSLKSYSDYQYIVIDMDSNLDIINAVVFDSVDQIVLVEKPGEISARKMQIFMEQVTVQEQRDKMLVVHNLAESNSVYYKGTDIPVIGSIHNYGTLNLRNTIQAMNSNKGYDVDQLLRL